MKTPPFLIGAALLFWGWQTGQDFWGLGLAALVEGARWIKVRWDWSNANLNRIHDLGVLFFACIALLLYSTEERLTFVFQLTQKLPICLLPIMLAQVYGTRDQIPMSVFWWVLRRSPETPLARKSYNVSYLYFAVCLLAASASMRSNEFFYPGVALLIALGLTARRPRRVSGMAWIILLALAANAGVASHNSLRNAQDSMERALGTWLAGFFSPSQQQRECVTKIGVQGAISQSPAIVMRLRPEPGGFAPSYLRETAWDLYKNGTWSASNSDFMMARAGSGDLVKLLPTNVISSSVEIARYFEDGVGPLACPHGTFQLEGLSANLRTNRLGCMAIDNGPGLVEFTAYFGYRQSIDSPPTDRDLVVPENERPVLGEILGRLNIADTNDSRKIKAVAGFFQSNNFIYSLHPLRNPIRVKGVSGLGWFLTNTHRGHCEYFATATVLMLRQAGVPARYVTGYIVPETSRRGDSYLVRERDAHAWALVYHRDTRSWEQLDTTPSGGARTPERASWWQSLSDTFSDIYFQFSKWRWSKTSFARYTVWLIVPLIVYLALRIIFDQRRRLAAGPTDAPPPSWPGMDSELYEINRHLAAAGLDRRPDETLRSWQIRLGREFPDSDVLRRIFRLHYGLRFDPLGLTEQERNTLRAEARRWLADHANFKPNGVAAPADEPAHSGSR